ncbi:MULTISPECIES: ferritin-like domain-containing protein [unclassified Sphingomonas]|uniref:ferritin-like domain-containing protein n=1 Tax=unclassified Sphingomonas TaxID=196159 RepID=UPI0006F1EFA8|nr:MULTISPECIES: ferritin-like domain-containing protein [unclassified Sphingomonas]KQX17801.1 rhamnosyltransferase [Sphingomonas sp. Root1294]KQY70727.1 rhamnosyltransferase [Sphingomonas sp. Root50]KRB91780.1 rhamnosyltransferase [Sphingomonas sp. Root720]
MVSDISAACRAVLDEAQPLAKVKAARRAAREWRLGRTAWGFGTAMPDRPARTGRPPLLPPSHMPKRGRAGSPRARIAMLHALAHIEYVAIDLAFDLVGRFGGHFPRRFVDDWVAVGAEEAMHFALIERRLIAYGARYGDLPAHDGLWEAAAETAHDPLARLAVVPMVLEARGLDVTPSLISRFDAAGDDRSARIMRRIAEDEVDHVAAGVAWFRFLCDAARIDCVQSWQSMVQLHFRGPVKPPFNDSARDRAGLTKEMMVGVAAPHDLSHNPTSRVRGGNS